MRRPLFLALAGLVAALAGCGDALRWDDTRVDLLWPGRQVVFALSPARARVDAYAIRNGVAWLGGASLPARERFGAMALDPAAGRLWLWSERGGLVLDARTLRPVARWQADTPALPVSAGALVARAPANAEVLARRGDE